MPVTRSRPLVAALLLAVAPMAARAQASPLAGRWAIEFTAGMRVENDEPTAIRAKGTLTITEEGDSLVATLKTEPIENMPPRPEVRLAAKKGPGNAVTFVQRSQARLNMNGEEREVTSISTWSLTATGDALAGSVRRELEGMQMPGMPEQPVTGTRVH
jgi:hypothetical protein